MTREEMAALAQQIVDGVVLPEPGARVAVVVTDAEGAWVGVAHNRQNIEDLQAMFVCAIAGEDRVDHVRWLPPRRSP